MIRLRVLVVLPVVVAVALTGGASAATPNRADKSRPRAGKKHVTKKPVTMGANHVKPVGWAPLTSAAAAKLVHRSGWEPRPQNYTADHTVPSASQLTEWRAQSEMPYAYLVNGRFKGTTDEIIQWAAYKWGLPVEVLRAVATYETWWEQSFVGDNGDSFGIFQVRRPYHCFGECTIVRESTAFTADYYGGVIRAYYDGKETWLNNPDIAAENGASYAAGDLWGSIGAWCDGRWHTQVDEEYVAGVKGDMTSKPWLTPEFVGQ